MKLKAFTLIETIVAIVILGILGSCLISTMRPHKAHADTLKKAGSYMCYQLDIATKQLLAKNSTNYSMLSLFTFNKSKFSITDDDAEMKLSDLYKKYLVAARQKQIPAKYLNIQLHSETKEYDKLYIKSLNEGFLIRNETYFAFRLNGNCETKEDIIYSPMEPDKRTAENSCGVIFYDVNFDNPPNTLGIDQYIVAIGKTGIK